MVFFRQQNFSAYYRTLVCITLILVLPELGLAKNKKKKQKKPKSSPTQEVNPSDLYATKIKIGKKKKTKNYEVICYGEVGGRTKRKKGKLIFTSFTSLSKQSQKKVKKTKTRSKKAKLKKLAQIQKQLAKASKQACSNGDDGNGGGGSKPAIPTYESLKAYSGNFTLREARILHDRFGLGASFKELQAAVTTGLKGTVTQLQSWKPESELEAAMKDYRCDQRFAWQESNKECSTYNPNDFKISGLVQSLYHALLNTSNPYFYRLFLFLHDERATAGLDNLRSEERYAVLHHVDMLMNAAKSGDLKQFSLTYNQDHIGALKYLDNALNDGESPNENWARELWELNTTGTTYLNEKNERVPVYSPLDIAQASLAHSGWTFANDEREAPSGGDDYTMIVKAFSPIKAAQGSKVIFQGTPYEAVVYDGTDVVEATFRHPATAMHLAEELLALTITTTPSPGFIKRVAKLIEDNNFNIHPVMKILAESEALYAEENEKNLVKLPIDFVIGFLRATKYPINSLSELDSILKSLDQRILHPVSVFGWDELGLTSDATTIKHRNAIRKILTRTYSLSGETNETSYSFMDNLLFDIYTNAFPAEAFVERATALLGVKPKDLNPLYHYLNYEIVNCNPSNDSECGPKSKKKFKRDAFDPHPDNESSSTLQHKVRGLLLAITQTAEYSLK